MKNIYKLLFVLFVAGAMFFSCDKLETNFAALTKAPEAGAPYYLQFINASQSFETGVTEAGGLVEVEKPISVVLMGMPQSQDITVNFKVDPSTTITTDMYTMSATGVTIPAGKSSGSVTLKTIASKMPVGQTLKLVLVMDAGANNSPNPDAIKLSYSLKRIEFCPLANGVADLVGSWSGDDAWYSSIVTTVKDGANLKVSHMSEEFIEDWWAETIVSGGTFTMTVKGNGIIDIPRQHIYTTVYGGANYDYDIKGSGKWDNCGGKPHMLITYDIYYEGEAKGLAATYSAYLDGIPYLTADITLSGKGLSTHTLNGNITKPAFKK